MSGFDNSQPMTIESVLEDSDSDTDADAAEAKFKPRVQLKVDSVKRQPNVVDTP